MTPGAGAFGAYEVDAFLADSVSVAGGRLFAHSAGWDHVLVPGLPARPGRVGIGVMLRIPEARAGKSFTLGLRLEGPDGEPLAITMPDVPDTLMAAQISGTLSDPGRPEGSPLPSHVVPMGFNLDGLRIEEGGLHALVVEIDGKEVLRRGFAVIVAEPAPA